jgi:hypothetical protein
LGRVIETRIISEFIQRSSFRLGCGAKMTVKHPDSFGTIIAVCDSAHMSCGVLLEMSQGIGGAAK